MNMGQKTTDSSFLKFTNAVTATLCSGLQCFNQIISKYQVSAEANKAWTKL